VQEGTQSVAHNGGSSNASKIVASALTRIVWEDIIVGAGPNYKGDNKIAKPLFTQLKGIRVNGILHVIQNINADVIQKIALKFNLPNVRSNVKKANADGLVDFRARQEMHKRDGTIKAVTAANVQINSFHFTNIITGSEILPVFQRLKGKSLDKSQLQEKLAQDQLLWGKVGDEYNDQGNLS
jgi:hypothetical protein